MAVSITMTSIPSTSKTRSSSSSPTLTNIRPAVILPGLGNNTGDYEKLKTTLRGYGVPTVVANVSRIDWLRNAAGLVDPNYWRGTLKPRPVLDCCCVGETLSIIGHSAGGWLARVYMEEFGRADISLLLTLGTPHLPPPKGVSGVIDQTRGLLNYVEKKCSKAVYSPELRYVCIAARYIQGYRLIGRAEGEVDVVPVMSMDNDQATTEAVLLNDPRNTDSSGATFRARFVGQGYKQVCGKADVWGDGVVPEESAHLEGALNISLEGVYHSPVGSDDELRPWYGSPAVVKEWIHHLIT